MATVGVKGLKSFILLHGCKADVLVRICVFNRSYCCCY